MEHAIFIGRFQPFHNAHLETVRFALKQAEKLVIVIGSAGGSRNSKNPWSAAERIAMITACLSEEEQGRTSFVCAKDYLYNNNQWLSGLQSGFAEAAPDMDDSKTLLVGHKKDASSFYLNLFPQWKFVETGIKIDENLAATKVRENMFRQDTLSLQGQVPTPVYNMLLNYMGTAEYKRLHTEWHDIQDKKAGWVGSPFPPTFNTVDTVVVCGGHVLLTRRGGKIGRGLLALPGGYLEQEEDIVDGCLRELREETSIRVPEAELKKHIEMEKTFAAPSRSLLGRVVTHAIVVNLGINGPLPAVKGGDDADKAFWMPFREVFARENEFFDDHWHMIQFFLMRF